MCVRLNEPARNSPSSLDAIVSKQNFKLRLITSSLANDDMTQRQGTNGRLRNLPLDERAFRTVFDVRRKIEEWRLDYNVQPAHIVQSIDVKKIHRALFEKLSLTVIRGLVMGAASKLVHAES